MHRLLFSAICAIALTGSVYAQGGRRAEFFVGYSNLQAEGVPDRNNSSGNFFENNFFERREGLHGGNAAVTGYFSDYFGLTGDFSFHRKENSTDLIGARNSVDTRVLYFMGGPQLKLRNSARFEPYVRALAGGAYTRFKVATRADTSNGVITNSFETGATDFAIGIGGGLDVRLGEKTSIRAFQIDYAPVFLRDRSINIFGQSGALIPTTLEGQRQDSIRISVGIVF